LKSIREILRDMPLIGRYVKWEDGLLQRYAKFRENLKKKGVERRRQLAVRRARPHFLKRLPYAGAVFRFPEKVRKGIEDIPLFGTFVAKPLFGAVAAITRPFRNVAKGLFRGIVIPFAALGVVSMVFYSNPDMTSDTLEDYLADQGYDTTIAEGVAHKNIRVYHDNILTFTFHSAGNMTAIQKDLAAERSGALTASFQAALAYPFAFGTALSMGLIEYNAFALPTLGNDRACFVRTISEDIDTKRMIAVLAGVPERHLNLDKDKLREWVPLMILGHEARHCDNGKDRYPAVIELYKMNQEYRQAYLQEMEAILLDENVSYSEAEEKLKDNPYLKAMKKQIALKEQEVQRLTLAGETDSDIYSVPWLDKMFPDSDVAEIITAARAVSPFAGGLKLGGSEDHSTASGLDSHLQGKDVASSDDVWDSIYMGKLLLAQGRFLNSSGPIVASYDETLHNYHVARQVVIPYLENMKGQSFQRSGRQVSYDLVLDQLRLFVEGVERLVKPESLAASHFVKVADIPFALKIAPVPVPQV